MIVKISSTFTKNHNSTKQASSGFTDYTVIGLKEPCTVLNPLIEISAFIPNACYAYIPAFNRYYFITNIESVTKDIWRYSMAVDVMGTYRSTILGSTQYCSRSSAGEVALTDNLITHKEETPTTEYNSINFGIAGETYVLEVAGKGGVKLYALNFNQLTSLIVNLFNDSLYGANVVDDTVKTYFNPFQYILSCRFFPFSVSGSLENINFGWWDSGISAANIGDPSVSSPWFTANYTLPTIDNTGNFYNKSPGWITHNLFVPGCGDIELPSDASGEMLSTIISVDLWTGQANSVTRYPGGATIARQSGQLSADVRISQLSADVGNLGMTLLYQQDERNTGFLADLFSGKSGRDWNPAQSIFNFLDALLPGTPVKNALQPNLAHTSATGNITFLKEHRGGTLSTRYYSPYNVSDVHNKFNYADCKNRLLSNLTGYTICESPYIDINGTTEETNTIKAFMKGGFYIE